MGFRSLFTKGVALSQAGQTNKHSRKASSYAKQAMNCFRQAKSLKAEKKIDKMLDGLNHLSNSVLEVSDSVTPISMMNATSALLADKTIDIYFVAGQSNAHGHAHVSELTAEQATQDGLFYTSWHNGTSDASSEQYYSDWATSVIAGETRGDDNNPIIGDSAYFGPEIGFASKAKELQLTDRGFGIIKHAIGASTLIDVGGTPDRSDWDLTAIGDKKGDAYRAFKSAITDGLNKLEAQGYGYNLKGMIWWQGESNGSLASSYLIDFIDDFNKLKPFGSANSHPKFLVERLKIFKPKIINNFHIQCLLKDDKNKFHDSFAFNARNTKLSEYLLNYKKEIAIICQLRLHYKNNNKINILIDDIIT